MLPGQIICEYLFIMLALMFLAGIVAIPTRDRQPNSPEELQTTNARSALVSVRLVQDPLPSLCAEAVPLSSSMLVVHMQQTAYKTGLGLKPSRLSTHSMIKTSVSVSSSSSISVPLAAVKVRFPCSCFISFGLGGPDCDCSSSRCGNEMSECVNWSMSC